MSPIPRKEITQPQPLGKHLETHPGSKSHEELTKILEGLLSSVSDSLKAPVCKIDTSLDCQSALVRTEESASGNWFADVLRHYYDDALCLKAGGGSDGVFICGGTLRGDSTYGPGMRTTAHSDSHGLISCPRAHYPGRYPRNPPFRGPDCGS